ncbi:MAG: peptidase M64 [Bacteroidales bacterium]|nr:peptidase M64 [Bacteroidales bacterium]
MKKLLFLVSIFVVSSILQAQNYNDYFTSSTLRIDYMHSGTANTEDISFVRFVKDKIWAGNPNNLIDTFGYGKYIVKVYDEKTEKLIYSYGFCSLFEEWQTTEEAQKIKKAFEESLIIPYPKSNIRIELLSRQADNSFLKIHEFNFSTKTEVETIGKTNIKTKNYINNGDYKNRLDIAVVGDGYTEAETENFYAEASKIIDFLLNDPAIKPLKHLINVNFIQPISLESGVDFPSKNIWKNTALDSRFDTFYSDRYLTTASYHKLRDAVSGTPCDQIIILVNTDNYGGGGIYNFYSITCSNHAYAPEVLVHEFGHAFAALGDEYYDSETSYIDFYNLKLEPYQPNLTTLVDFDSKWKNMMSKETPIPTPVEIKYKNTVGVFEGGGYMAKGIFRPAINCKMKELEAPFCKVCENAIQKMIKFYAD